MLRQGMVYRLVRPLCSHYAYGRRHFMPAEGWPTRRVWTDRFENDHLRLETHPIWQLARVSDELKQWAIERKKPFEAWSMADAPRGEPFGLVYGLRRGGEEYAGIVYARDPVAQVGFTEHHIAMTRDHIEGVCGLIHGLSWIIDFLARRDPYNGAPLPVPVDEGPIDEDDVAALEGLLP